MADRDWSPEMLEQIATVIKILSDYIRFRAVCKPWRSSTPAIPTPIPCQLPWLLYPHDGGDESSSTTNNYRCSIFEVDCNKHHYLRLPEPLHDHHRRCRSSSHGWVFISEPLHVVFILNPFTGAKLNLPPLLELLPFSQWDDDVNSFLNSYSLGPIIRKFALSDSPSQNPDFTALAILDRSGDLASCKSDENHWTIVPGIDTHIMDAVYFNGMVYALDGSGSIIVCDVSRASPEVLRVMPIKSLDYGDTYYLVSACDELLAVAKLSREFKVYRLDSFGQRWERVNDLGDLALFVGGNSCSSAVTASDFPGCRGNSVYFTEDDSRKEQDMGNFSLEDGIFRLPCDVCISPAHPIWITPDPF